MSSNPTLDAATFSKQLIQDEIRPALSTYLGNNFTDPQANKRGDPIPDEPGTWPPLVVTALPGGGRVLYPHVVVQEGDDSAGPIDTRHDFDQHDFTVDVEIHGTTSTQMFNLRGMVRGYFLDNREALKDAGFAMEGDDAISGSSADWDPTSKTASWSMSVTGLVHTD